MISARSPATGRPQKVDCTPTGYGPAYTARLPRSASITAPTSLLLGLLAVLDLGEVVVVELDVPFVGAGQHVDRVLDVVGFLVAFARVAAVTLLAEIDLLALER